MTPNNHALVKQFGLYHNFYDAGTNSAEGHNWMMQADNPEYTQSLAGQYVRSYDTEDDALGHQESGFIRTGAEAAGKTVRDFGEFQQFLSKPANATWQNLYCDARNMAANPSATTAYPLVSTSPIPSLNSVSDTAFPKFDTSVPDIYREQIWKRDFEKNGPAKLNMFWLSSDHTGGPPSPAAQVADNDLALGQMVDEISHSRYWNQSAIFVVEDDSQAGADVPAGQTEAAIQKSTAVPAAMEPLAAQWAKWQSQQRTTGPNAVPDYANPEQMNRYVWYQTTGWKKPYPGDSKIYAPNQVPGAALPPSDSE